MLTNAGEFKSIFFASGNSRIEWKFTLISLIEIPWFYTRTFFGTQIGWKISDEFEEMLIKYGARNDYIEEVKSMKSVTAEHSIYISNSMFAELRLLDVIVPRP